MSSHLVIRMKTLKKKSLSILGVLSFFLKVKEKCGPLFF